MGITSALVLYAVIWFAVFLTIIPVGLKTQGDVGDIVEGTQAGAPYYHNLRKKAWLSTAIAFAIWLVVFVVVFFEIVTVRDIDMFGRMGPAPEG